MRREGWAPLQYPFENDTKFNYVVSFNFESHNFNLYFELIYFLKISFLINFALLWSLGLKP